LEFPGRHDWSIGLYVGGLYLGRIVAPSVSAVLVDEPSWRAAVDVAAWVEDRIAPYSARPSDLPAQANHVVNGWVNTNARVWATQAVIGWFALVAAAGEVLSLCLRPLPPDAPGPLRG